jgi:cytochrome c biogenesis protein CcdA
VGLCEFPYTGGPYLMILGLLHDSATYISGFGYLILYNLIFVSPLVLILLLASNQALLSKVQEWQRSESKTMRFSLGIAMIILGLLIFLM